MGSLTQYVGAVGINSILPPADIAVPSTFKEATTSSYADKRMDVMKKELYSFDEHKVAALTPACSKPPNLTVIGMR